MAKPVIHRILYRAGRWARAGWHDADIILFHYPLSTQPPAPLQSRVPIRIEPVTAANVAEAATMEPAFRVRQFRQFLAQGDLGFFAYDQQRLIHRSWVQLGPRVVQQHHEFAPYELAAGEAYIHYCETAPAARGQGVYPAVLSHILGVLRDRGLTACYIATRADNTASCRGIIKAGFREYRRTHVTSRFGRTRLRITPSCAAF